jgi:hypothetical protein
MGVEVLKSFVCLMLLILASATTDPVQAQSRADTLSSVSVQHTVIADTLPPRVFEIRLWFERLELWSCPLSVDSSSFEIQAAEARLLS